jgi:integrase
MSQHRETPVRRVNPSGAVVWVALHEPPGHRKSAGTFKRKRDAQAAIDAAYGRAERIENVGGYVQRWPRFHPRTERTQRTNEHRITRALDLELDGVPLREWAYTDLRRRHALALIDVLLTEQGRSALGATHIIRALSVMTEDAITDEVAELNPFKGVAVRANDPRVSERPRPVRVLTFEQMHAFARAGGSYEPMLRTFADTGMRLGEVLALRREDFDGRVFQVRRTAHNGRAQQGTKTDHGESGAGRIVPCPAELAELIRVRPARIPHSPVVPHAPGKDLVGAQLLSRRMGAGSAAVGPRHPTSRDAPLLCDPPPRRPDRRRRPGRNRRSHRADDDRPLHACTAALVRSGATGDRTRSMNTVVAFWSHGCEEPSSQAREHRPTEPKVWGSNRYGRAHNAR